MKKLTIVLILVLAVFVVNAKEKENNVADNDNSASLVISGSVADVNSGETLVGVEVKIEGTDMKTYTDFDGNFSFKEVKPGEYKIVTNYISYQQKTENLHVSSNDNEIKIKLQSSN